MRRLLLLLWACLLPLGLQAHIGSPNVIFEGVAGQVPVRVIIRPPGVVPGLAEIDVRALTGTAHEITVLPVFWQTGRKGSPPPDRAEPVRGETNLYHAKLWLMSQGAYSVDVRVSAGTNSGTVSVPVNSQATARNVMPRWFGAMLAACGCFLFLTAVRLVGAAFGEGILAAGSPPTRRQRWSSWGAMAAAAIFFGAALWGGRAWWNADDRDYRQRRLYNPAPLQTKIREQEGQPILRVGFERGRRWKPLLPDHGKLMHLFLLREQGLDAFAHLHPVQDQSRGFETAIPPLPGGQYRVYAEMTHEDGASETLMGTVLLPQMTAAYNALWQPSNTNDIFCSPGWLLKSQAKLALPPDADDSWLVSEAGRSRLPGGHTVEWLERPIAHANRAVSLRFRLLSREGTPVPFDPYMGMMGHLIVRKKDGSVFAHVHPSGNFSMASQRFFIARTAGGSLAETTNLVNTIAAANHSAETRGSASEVSFPYEFPSPGTYRIWTQLKAHEHIFTGVFDLDVGEAERGGSPRASVQ